MESKVVVYAVLAVALGYLLVSAVPDRLAALRGVTQRGGAEEMESLGAEEAAPGEESLGVPDEVKGEISELETAEGVEPELATPRGGWDTAVSLGVWVINLMLALGVYFVVKRRLS